MKIGNEDSSIGNEDSSIGNEDSSMILMIENEDSSTETNDGLTDLDEPEKLIKFVKSAEDGRIRLEMVDMVWCCGGGAVFYTLRFFIH